MEISEERLKETRQEAERRYKAIGSIYCPYLEDHVHFSAEGFVHLLFKARERPRQHQEQYTRLRLLPLAEEVIKKSHTLQEYDRRVTIVRVRSSGPWSKVPKWANFYVFIALIRDVRIKVVIREIEGGKKHFYSLFPSWKVKREADGTNKKIFYSEDPSDL